MSSQKTCFVLGDERTCATTQYRYLLLDFLDVVFAGFEIDLWRVSNESGVFASMHTSLIATTSPVALQIPLNTVPNEPLPSSNKLLVAISTNGWRRKHTL